MPGWRIKAHWRNSAIKTASCLPSDVYILTIQPVGPAPIPRNRNLNQFTPLERGCIVWHVQGDVWQRRPADVLPRALRQNHMSSIPRPPNQLLQALPAEDFELVGARLKPLQMIRETVLVEAGVMPAQIVFPHGGAVSIVVNLSEGQSV